jgi:hypothetical protein
LTGTPEYLAPERIAGKDFDHRADVYSLGAMAYEMLSGVPPLHGRDPEDTLAMQLTSRPLSINARPGPAVPRELEAVVMTMLEKNPDRRPADMAEVEALLLEAQIAARLSTRWDDLPLPAMAPARAMRISRKLGRPPRQPWPVAAAAFVAVALFGWSGLGSTLRPRAAGIGAAGGPVLIVPPREGDGPRGPAAAAWGPAPVVLRRPACVSPSGGATVEKRPRPRGKKRAPSLQTALAARVAKPTS